VQWEEFEMKKVIAGAALALVWAVTPLAVSAVTLTPAPPAGATCQSSAAQTVCRWDEAFATPFPVPYGISCGAFAVRVNLAGQRDVTAFYDANGSLVRKILHSSYVGTLINGVTGASVPHRGVFTIFDDLAAGTRTITGMLSRTVVNGDGLVWRNIGRIVISLQNGTVLFEAGEHGTWDVVTDPTTSAELCEALS
jgi:hypothetical protein